VLCLKIENCKLEIIKRMYELLIIGGGPGGVAAGVYAARKKIKTILITDSFGGQSLTSADIQNWIGTPSISGFDLAQALEKHLRAQEGIEIIGNDRVTAVATNPDGSFTVTTGKGKNIETKCILLASGSRHRKLGVPGEKELDGKGVAYCATCDAPLFAGKDVAVVGGGNAGLEAVIDLMPYATKIYVLERGTELKGDPVTQEKIRNSEKVRVIMQAETQEIVGKDFVTGIKYRDAGTGETKELALGGVFVEIGAIPNSDFVKGIVDLTPFGEVIVDHKTQQSSVSGIWAVGDVSDVLYKQNNISVGDAVKAVLNIDEVLHK
jgi:alkyl hydroperoxide reductase subunit F